MDNTSSYSNTDEGRPRGGTGGGGGGGQSGGGPDGTESLSGSGTIGTSSRLDQSQTIIGGGGHTSSPLSQTPFPSLPDHPKGALTKLNVGGEIFCTSLDTLTKDTESMLYAMFSGSIPTRKDEATGAFFIDRDPTFFRYILNYLRDGHVDLMRSPYKLRQLLLEARFFQIGGLIELVQNALASASETGSNAKYAVVSFNSSASKRAEIEDVDCAVLNQLAGQGYQVEGFAGRHPHYYALVRKQLN